MNIFMTVFFIYTILKAIKKTRTSLKKKTKNKPRYEINIFKTVENIVRQEKQ